jgi:hypothetical protein
VIVSVVALGTRGDHGGPAPARTSWSPFRPPRMYAKGTAVSSGANDEAAQGYV